eukprot:190945-Chlamydomonas_euryale.AAC.6
MPGPQGPVAGLREPMADGGNGVDVVAGEHAVARVNGECGGDDSLSASASAPAFASTSAPAFASASAPAFASASAPALAPGTASASNDMHPLLPHSDLATAGVPTAWRAAADHDVHGDEGDGDGAGGALWLSTGL